MTIFYRSYFKWIPMRRVYTVMFLLLSSWAAIAEEVNLQHNDLSLNGELVLAPEQSLSDGVILILHGTLGHSGMEIVSTLQALFAESERNSLAINLSLDVDDRHGFLPCESEHTHTMEDAGEELNAWLTWLKSVHAGEIVLLGHSRGGNQVARFVANYDPDIAAAILIAPSSGAELAAAGRDRNLQQAKENSWLHDVAFLHCSNATVSAESYVSYYGPSNPGGTAPILNNIDVPVLVFAGTEDQVVPDLAEHMRMVKRNNIVFEEIDGADHFFRDLYADDIVERSLEFLEAVCCDEASNKSGRLITWAESFVADARLSAKEHRPIVVFVSQTGCQFCEALRQNVLFPMMRSGQMQKQAVFREVSLDEGFAVEDFDGATIAGAKFAQRYAANVTPTMLFLDSGGKELTKKRVGISNIEYYGFYLGRSIKVATAALE